MLFWHVYLVFEKHGVSPYWPSLFLGTNGTTTGLHRDNGELPFFLSLISGKKLFRVLEFVEKDWETSSDYLRELHQHILEPESRASNVMAAISTGSLFDVWSPSQSWPEETFHEAFVLR